jgi:Protein of unknown function (DUF3079)
MRRILELPAHPERICWGCDKYCGLAFTLSPLVRIGSACLLAGVILNATQATVSDRPGRLVAGEADMKRGPAKITTRC